MRRAYPSLVSIELLLALGLLCCRITWPQETSSERATVLSALTHFYGSSVDNKEPIFVIAPGLALTPVFSSAGLLIRITIEPKSDLQEQNPQHPVELSRSEFELVLATINSIKPLGGHEEDEGVETTHGGTRWGAKRYHDAYLMTGRPMNYASSGPVTFASIYYLHPVTGLFKIPRDSSPEDVGSFGLVCVEGKAYILPKTEFIKLLSNPIGRQTVELAGPTGDNCKSFESKY